MIHEYGDDKVGSQYCSPTSQDSHITGENSGGRIRVYRRKGERYADACVTGRDRCGGGSVMVWAAVPDLDKERP